MADGESGMRKNARVLAAAQIVNAGGAFVFWALVAHLFSSTDVGLAAAAVSYASLASAFTTLGLPTTIVRFLPSSRDQPAMISAGLLAVTAASAIGAVVAIAMLGLVSPVLARNWTVPLDLLLGALILGNALNPLAEGLVLSFRKGEYILTKSCVVAVLRLALPLALLPMGVAGIVGTYAAVLLVGVTYNGLMAYRLAGSGSRRPSLDFMHQRAAFMAGNYFGGMLGILPSSLITIITLNSLGARESAYLFIPIQLSTFLNILSVSTSQALVAESAHTDQPSVHWRLLRRATRSLLSALIPLAAGACLLGWVGLRFYGSAYAEKGYFPLVVLSLSSLPVAVNWLGDTWLNVRARPLAYFMMNGLNAGLVVVLVAIGAESSILAVAWGWFAAQVITAVIYVGLLARDRDRFSDAAVA
ncbi:hypothetical protein acdb102_19410 [Acidothermaceae bacterium B102]|nr:hypothetical protein acdb102_19410 [Acidothermaceae bacterium B102]